MPGRYDQSEGVLWCVSDTQTHEGGNTLVTGDIIYIELYKCYKTARKDCMNNSVIDTAIASSRGTSVFRQIVYDPENYDDPISYAPLIYNPTVTQAMMKRLNIYLFKADFQTDKGFMLTDIEKDTQLGITQVQETFDDVKATAGFFMFRLRFEGDVTVFKRSYDKIQNVLAQWNPIFTILILLGKILIDNYTAFKVTEQIVNGIFRLNMKPKKSEKDTDLENKPFNEDNDPPSTKTQEKSESVKSLKEQNCLKIELELPTRVN